MTSTQPNNDVRADLREIHMLQPQVYIELRFPKHGILPGVESQDKPSTQEQASETSTTAKNNTNSQTEQKPVPSTSAQTNLSEGEVRGAVRAGTQPIAVNPEQLVNEAEQAAATLTASLHPLDQAFGDRLRAQARRLLVVAREERRSVRDEHEYDISGAVGDDGRTLTFGGQTMRLRGALPRNAAVRGIVIGDGEMLHFVRAEVISPSSPNRPMRFTDFSLPLEDRSSEDREAGIALAS